jgi:hypothetical protein
MTDLNHLITLIKSSTIQFFNSMYTVVLTTAYKPDPYPTM